MRPRLDWLETFLAIADTGSLTHAARRVARSQSAVSLQLRQLEGALDTRLFDRNTRCVRLTSAGERLVPWARNTLAAADAAALAVQDGGRRVLRVGVPEEYTDRLLPELLGVASRHDPGVEFEVECTDSAELERRVEQGRLDYAVVLADEIKGQGLAICSDPVLWMEAPGCNLSRQRPLPVALFDHACSWRHQALDALAGAGLDYRVVFTSASVSGVRTGIRSGVAVGVLSRSTAGPGLEPLGDAAQPQRLPDARLVLIGTGINDTDARLVVDRVRAATGR